MTALTPGTYRLNVLVQPKSIEEGKDMRIVTRPDFDGVVCAALLKQAEPIDQDILWVEPNEIQKNKIDIQEGDILANLPFSPNCSMWFDHHVSNTHDITFKGAYEIAPSAAGLVYRYYRKKEVLDNRYDELILQTDIIDAADLTMDQVQSPEKYPYLLLSMTIQNHGYQDIHYWNELVDLLAESEIDRIMAHPEVQSRCQQVIDENNAFEKHLKEHTAVKHNISITDFRHLDTVPEGNRFLTYALYPDSIASIKIKYAGAEKQPSETKNVQVSVGRSIFHSKGACRVNIGKMLSRFGGGGHAGAGGCTLDGSAAGDTLEQIIQIMFNNQSVD